MPSTKRLVRIYLSNMSKLKLAILPAADPGIAGHWNKLWFHAKNATIFNSYPWFQVCLASHPGLNCQIYALYLDNQLVAIAPLAKSFRFGVPTLSSIDDDHTVDTPFLLKDYSPKLVKSLFSHLMLQGNLYVSKLDPDISLVLHQIYPRLFLTNIFASPYIPFADDPLRFVSRSTFKNLRGVEKKFPGRVSYQIYDSSHDLKELTDKIFYIDQHSGKHRRSRDIFSKAENRDFYRRVIEKCSKYTLIGFLNFDGRPVAYQIGFKYGKIFMAYQTSYLNDFRYLSPGKAMIIELLKWLKQTDVNYFDFCGGVSTYKQEFTHLYHFQFDLYYSKNPAIQLYWTLINFARLVKKRLFPEKHTRDHEFQYLTFAQTQKLPKP
jgi:hypothetical protein